MGHALITGGSSGIGFALAMQLAREGHAVSIFARDNARLVAARQKIRSALPLAQVFTWSVDVCDNEACADIVQRAVAHVGPPSWAIACAGIVRPTRFLDQTLSNHLDQMKTNYFGALNFTYAIVPSMIANGGGKLVFISSAASICGMYGYSGYGASKFAVRGLAESLRVELYNEGIDVALVYAPDTNTPQLAAERAERSPITSRIAETGGVWQPEDLADVIIASVKRGRFLVLPGIILRLFYAMQGIVAPIFRIWQRRIITSMSLPRR